MKNRTTRTLETAVVLIAGSNAYTRRLTRTMLINCGVRSTYEASDGAAVLEAIERVVPDILIMDWELPVLDGPEVLRIIRSPDTFSKPNLPVILLSDTGLQSRVTAAVRLGAHEVLLTPLSPRILQERICAILSAPRPMVRAGKSYIPLPRRRPDLGDLLEEVAS